MKTPRLLLTALAAVLFSANAQAASAAISTLPAASSVAPTNLTIVVDLTEPNPALQTKKANVTQLVDGLPAASAGAKGTMSAADKIKLDAATASATVSTLALRDSSGNTAFHSIALTAGTVANAPSNPTDITNKAYVDAVSTGLAVHTPAVAATVGSNITLAGGAPSTLDGVTLSAANRILVKDQTDPKQNGIYTVSVLGSGSNGTWVRASDANSGANLVSGSYIFINGGTTWSSSAWVMTTPGAITIGVSDINWTLFNQVTNILASNIIGQIVQAQIADASINTAKFASGIEPVSIVSSLPSPSGYTGPKNVFSTGDSKLYRYNGTAFTAAVATTDLSGTITTTQIADNSISTPKLQANVVTAAKIAAGTITANEIAADTITAGQIAAGAVNTSELAANAVTAAKITAGTITTTQIAAATILASNIAAGTITADRLNVSTLSAISANIGTVTAGTITGVSITTNTGLIAGFTLSSSKLSASGGSANIEISSLGSMTVVSPGQAGVTIGTDFTGITASIAGSYNSNTRFTLSAANSGAILKLYNSSPVTPTITLDGTVGTLAISGAATLSSTLAVSGTASYTGLLRALNQLSISGAFYKDTSDGWTPRLYTGDGTTPGDNIEFQYSGGSFYVRVNGGTPHAF